MHKSKKTKFASLSADFSYRPFSPSSWMVHAHLHTIYASQFLRPAKPPAIRQEISTPDGDFLEVDVCEVPGAQQCVGIFHGLEGSSGRHYVRSIMSLLYRAGISSAALNFRGCGSRMNDQPRFYHSGATDDYETFFRWLHNRYPDMALYGLGYSLGGNALIKYVVDYPDHPLESIAAVSPPYDLKAGSVNLQRGFNRVYERYFMKSLIKKLNEKRKRFPVLPEFSGSTLYEFDDRVTAPVHGFRDADHYYEHCSSKRYLPDVDIPLLLIHSKQDTLTPLAYAPIQEIQNNNFITPIFTDEGGHVGFISKPRGWLDETLVHWFRSN